MLKLENQVSPELLAKCGGSAKHAMMEKEGQVNTQFQQRHFVLWPRDPCRLAGGRKAPFALPRGISLGTLGRPAAESGPCQIQTWNMQ